MALPNPPNADTSLDPERLLNRFGVRFESGDVLFQEGEPGTEAYLLEEGRVRLIKSVGGVERSLIVLKPGDLFGESALILGSVRSSTAVALSPGLALALDQPTLQNLLEHNPQIASRIVKQLVRRLHDAEDQIEIMMLSEPTLKVVCALLKLAQRENPDLNGPVVFPITPMELASRVGIEVEAVKRAVKYLRESHYLRVSDERLEIVDPKALRHLFVLLGEKEGLKTEIL